MDELELLKQDWSKEKDNEFKIYSEDELFQMTKKKSVSVAKWVFIIALCEILFWIGLGFLLEEKSLEEPPFRGGTFETIVAIFDAFATAMPFLFLGIIIYLNYKIRNTEDPKKLMRKILLMKNAVRWYIRIFLIEVLLVILISSFFSIYGYSRVDYMVIMMIIPILALFTFIIILFLRFIYHLIYGNLIYKLEKNYKELQEMETLQ
ncbi:MAG: hypothetical protein Q4A00_03460 [Flavobacteriaceae bacterium]|nr:hypothetical protein [Flavobacteriaceae bacterium]